MNDNQKAAQFIDKQHLMVVAVALDDGSPWAVPVAIRHRDGNVFEWDSKLDTIHSQAIAVRSAMAITIFDKTDGVPLGVYAKGRGELVEEFKPGFGRYRFTAEASWFNDETFVKREVSLA